MYVLHWSIPWPCCAFLSISLCVKMHKPNHILQKIRSQDGFRPYLGGLSKNCVVFWSRVLQLQYVREAHISSLAVNFYSKETDSSIGICVLISWSSLVHKWKKDGRWFCLNTFYCYSCNNAKKVCHHRGEFTECYNTQDPYYIHLDKMLQEKVNKYWKHIIC
jgi:hypothetical protein